jgi:hypothetical protein
VSERLVAIRVKGRVAVCESPLVLITLATT